MAGYFVWLIWPVRLDKLVTRIGLLLDVVKGALREAFKLLAVPEAARSLLDSLLFDSLRLLSFVTPLLVEQIGQVLDVLIGFFCTRAAKDQDVVVIPPDFGRCFLSDHGLELYQVGAAALRAQSVGRHLSNFLIEADS